MIARYSFSSGTVVTGLAWTGLLGGLYASSLYSYLLFHTLIEIFCGGVAFGIFILAWNSRTFMDNRYLLFLGIVHLFVGILDLFHLLAYKGMNIFRGYDADLPTQVWMISRFLLGFSLLLSPLTLKRPYRMSVVLFSYFSVCVLLLLSVFYWRNFPSCYIEGKGLTSFKITGEYVIVALFTASALLLLKHRAAFDRQVLRRLLLSIGGGIAAEIAFTSYVSVYDLSNMAGHYLKLFSFYFLYKAIIETGLVRPYRLLFRDLKQREEELDVYRVRLEKLVEARTAQLSEANRHLQREIAERTLAEESLRKTHDTLEARVRERTATLEQTNGEFQREIRERKLTEEKLRLAKEEAESASKEKSAFLANISHEVRTPLNGIIGMLELFSDTPLTDEQREFFESIEVEANALLGLISGILDFSKIEAGKIDLEESPFDLHALLASIEKSEKMKVHQKGLDFLLSVDRAVPGNLSGDAARLRQVIVNLISNAAKFTSKGIIGVSVAVEERSDTAVRLRFEVRDTGIGIPKEKQADIFSSFTQVDPSTTRIYGGTGLGLAICKQLVLLMGGTIGVESEYGKGSTFHFTVSFGRETALPGNFPPGVKGTGTPDAPRFEKIPGAATEERPCSGLHILLAEDYPTNQRVALRYLVRAGYKVDVAENGIEAVELFRKNRYDLILMDIQMPLMDGFMATKEIRAQEERSGSSVPIIAMTAHAFADYREKCITEGMDDYITKPLRKASLLSLVKTWTKGSAPERGGQEDSGGLPGDGTGEREDNDMPPMDFRRAVEEFEGDRDFILSLLGRFLFLTREQIPVITRALLGADSGTLVMKAHSIKGGAANLTALGLASAAQKLETAGASGRLDQGLDALRTLMHELRELEEYFREMSISLHQGRSNEDTDR